MKILCISERRNFMREIKFRAWHKNNNSMCKNVTTDLLGRNYLEFMQYTGLKDKSDKEIYEGDIVLGLKYLKAKVVYGFCGFELHWIDGNTDKVRRRKSEEMFHNTSIVFEVIGNIYENPELLEDLNG
jgi:uncharacterized phage protein (TIGR01671 family)